jgi:hypothetical protein
MSAVVPRIIDLRSEFEAQLRAVARIEAQIAKGVAGRAGPDLADVLQRELAKMLENNHNIRDVLTELASATRGPNAGS